MTTVIAQTFTDALGKLSNDEQKQAKLTAFELQTNPENPGLQYHRIDASKDRNFWSVRASRDIRIIVHKMAGDGGTTTLIAYVDHHDAAYDWAERRRIDVHPRTGSLQLVEVRERFEDVVAPAATLFDHADQAEAKPVLGGLRPDELLDIGVPEDWIDDLLAAGEGRFLALCEHIPAEAAEKLLVYAAEGILPAAQTIADAAADEVALPDPYSHPDTMRRFRVLDNVEDLQRALDYPWEKWILYLHPSQTKIAEMSFSGPARVAGSAGTGKTVVALHRAARLLRSDPDAKLLVTTFSRQLAASLCRKLAQLVDNEAHLQRARVLSFDDLALELFTLRNGFQPRLANREHLSAAINGALERFGNGEFREPFIASEWDHVVDAWQLKTLEDYETVPRIGRRQRLSKSQRARLWPIFEAMISGLSVETHTTMAAVKGAVAQAYAMGGALPFTHVIVDEAQDLSVADLRLISAIAPHDGDALFFAGDLGQRIFQEPFSWAKLGINIRGRSHTLKVNYRTSHQIRSIADALLPSMLRDADGVENDRLGTVSIFNGPAPIVRIYQSTEEEDAACAETLNSWISDSVAPGEMVIFVRDQCLLPRVRCLVTALGIEICELAKSGDPTFSFDLERINIGTMHDAKGMEFKAVLVMACDDKCLPMEKRVDTVRDIDELNAVIETERHLLYVASTRAREFLSISATHPGSEFLQDLRSGEALSL